jgi:hypothetical protein
MLGAGGNTSPRVWRIQSTPGATATCGCTILHYVDYSWGTVKDELYENRDECSGFAQYEAGYTPEQHLGRQDQHRREEFQRKTAWLGFWGAVVGGLTVAVVRWITSQFSN